MHAFFGSTSDSYKLLQASCPLNNEVAELKNSIERNRQEVSNLKSEMVNQNKYIAFLENKLSRTSKHVKEKAGELKELQIRLDNLEQHSRKNSLEFSGMPNGVNVSTDQTVEAIGS